MRDTTVPLILEARKLSKEFKGFLAVDAVDLGVRRGSIHALIGPNGAGKTTMFNLRTRFLSPTRGSTRFKDQEITTRAPCSAGACGARRSACARPASLPSGSIGSQSHAGVYSSVMHYLLRGAQDHRRSAAQRLMLQPTRETT